MSLSITALSSNNYYTGTTGTSTSAASCSLFNLSDNDLLSYIDSYVVNTLNPMTSSSDDLEATTTGLSSNIFSLSDSDILAYIDSYSANLQALLGTDNDSAFN